MKRFDILDGVFMADQDGVWGFHDDEILHTAQGDEAAIGNGDVVVGTMMDDRAALAVAIGVGRDVRWERSPGSDIVPVEVRQHSGNAAGVFHDGVIDGDFWQG